MVKVLFVCTGNICRSPTAHGVFRHFVREAGLDARFLIDSAGTHGYHTGEAPDIRSTKAAKERGYDLSDLRARAVTYDDFEDFDYILCMDAGHKLTLERAAPKALHHKIVMFDDRDVSDPYYGGPQGFDDVLDQIETACQRWLDRLKAS